MKLSSILPSAFLGLLVALAACSSDGDGAPGATPDGPDSGKTSKTDGGTDEPGPPGRVETEILFADTTTFTKRTCSATVRWEGGGSDVKVAGQFTSPQWADGAQPMTKKGSVHELTVNPGPNAVPGKIYAYKVIADGNWKINPTGTYRKLVDGQMNSGVVLLTVSHRLKIAAASHAAAKTSGVTGLSSNLSSPGIHSGVSR